MLQVAPILAYAGVVVFILMIAIGPPLSRRAQWLLPAVAAAVFAGFSLVTIVTEGLLQFWVNHTTSLAGNQVWFDLLLAVAIGFYLIAPRARAVGMTLLPWGIAVAATASLALLPMLVRIVWLEQKSERG